VKPIAFFIARVYIEVMAAARAVLETHVGDVRPVSSGARAARVFTDTEDHELVQRRLALVSFVISIIVVLFWVLGIFLSAFFIPTRFWEVQLSVSKLSHIAIAAVVIGDWLLCRGPPRSRFVLSVVDIGGLFLLNAGLSVMIATQPAGMRGEALGVAALLLSAALRAAVVPSPPRWTAIVTATAATTVPIGSWIAIRDDRSWDEALVPRASFPFIVVAMCVAAVVTSYIIARIVYGLRAEVKSAMRLGQYTLEDEIGRGGMGVVYRARHALLRRPTAIKLLSPDKTGNAAEKRFEREVQITSMLTHPNTVAIYDFGHTRDGVFYYAMELLDGISLQELADEHGPQPPGRVVHILAQVASALAEAHAVGLIHRDIKPANVLLCERGGIPDFVKVLDFGLVKEVGHHDPMLSAANIVAGTPLYMAPESITKPDDVDARVDLYALGGVAYFLLTGTPPFEGSNLVEVCSHHLHTKPEPASKRLGKPVPDALEVIVAKCLAKSPADRPASAAALADELHALARDHACSWDDENARSFWSAKRRAR
jgi:serine/threonine-protein kinase